VSNRRMRRWSALAVAIALISVTAACGDDDDDAETGGGGGDGGGEDAGSIWVLLPDTASSDRWENDDRRYFSEAFEAAGLAEEEDYNIVNAEGDATTQQAQAEQAIADGASVIVLTSLGPRSGPGRRAERRRGGQQLVPVQAGLRRDGAGPGRGR
jgi:D-xylose transport system substrate-binding protein